MPRKRTRSDWWLPAGLVLLLGLFGALTLGYLRLSPPSDAAPAPRGRPLPGGPLARLVHNGCPQELLHLLGQLGGALRQGGAGVADLWDTDRMRHEVLQRLPPGPGRAIDAAAFRAAFESELPSLARRFRFQEFEVRQLTWTEPARAVVLTVRHTFDPGTGVPVVRRARWWATLTPDGWKFYDTEDVTLGWRRTESLAEIASTPTADPAGRLARLRAFVAAQILLAEGQGRPAEAALRQVDLTDLPGHLRALRSILLATLLVDQARYPEALLELDSADRARADIPQVAALRATCRYRRADFAGVVDPARAYLNRVGDDTGIGTLLAQTYLHLKQPEAALLVVRGALDDDGDNLAALGVLRKCLTNGDRTELGNRLLQTSDPPSLLGLLVAAALQDNDTESADFLVTTFQQQFPDALEGIVAAVGVALQRKQPGRADQLLRAALMRRRPGQGLELIAATAWHFAQAGQALALYHLVPPVYQRATFARLAEVLRDHDDPLHALLTVHARQYPDDPRCDYYHAVRAIRAGDRAAAERHYARAHQLADDEEEREAWRAERVANLVELGQALVAYQNVGPVEATFAQLANHLADRPAEFAPILARHKQVCPDAPTLPYYEGRLAYLEGRWADAVPLLEQYRAQPDGQPHLRDRAGELLVRCRVRLGQFAEARATLAQVPVADFPLLPVLLDAARGEVATVEQQLRTLLDGDTYTAWIYRDRDLGHYLRQPAFRPVRDAFPSPWFGW